MGGNESDNGALGGGNTGGVKKRPQKVTAATLAGSSHGYSTDDSAISWGNDDYNKRDKHHHKRRGGRRGDYDKPGDGGKASVIWMVLVIGLMFCLMDAAYIIRVLERGRQADAEALERLMEEVKQQQAANQMQVEKLEAEESLLSKLNLLPGNGPQAPKLNDFVPKTSSEKKLELFNMDGIRYPSVTVKQKRWKDMTPEEREARKKQREEEKRLAEEDRIKKIKMAALEALKAEHGGKIPDELLDQALGDAEAFKPRPMSYYKEASIKDDKDKILNLFIEAGLKEMDDSTYKVLPKWSEIARMYGEEPKIIGLEQCEAFQAKGHDWEHFVSTAGTFNSGTNLMAEMLIHNCHMQARMDKLGRQNRGVRWQVPWGKHTPPGDDEYRVEHKSKKDKDVDANMILPAVTVRDPYYWMQSMCKHHYTASWRGSDRCPNLTPTEKDKANFPSLKDKDYFPLSVRYADFNRHHNGLIGLWNDWYNEYKGVSFQRLFVRYEDLLFHPKEVAETVCHCAGGTMNAGNFKYVVDSAKKGIGAHGKVRTGYVDAIIKYGSERQRYNGYLPEDLKYAREHLDKAMMEELGYKYAPLDLERENDNQEEGLDGGNEDEDGEDPHKADEQEAPEIPEENSEENEAENESRAQESADAGDRGNDVDEDGDPGEDPDAGDPGNDVDPDADNPEAEEKDENEMADVGEEAARR